MSFIGCMKDKNRKRECEMSFIGCMKDKNPKREYEKSFIWKNKKLSRKSVFTDFLDSSFVTL